MGTRGVHEGREAAAVGAGAGGGRRDAGEGDLVEGEFVEVFGAGFGRGEGVLGRWGGGDFGGGGGF